MNKIKEAVKKAVVKKTLVKKTAPVVEEKPKVCPNCEDSGLDCSVCRRGYVV